MSGRRKRLAQRAETRPAETASGSGALRAPSRRRWWMAVGLVLLVGALAIPWWRSAPPPVVAVNTTGFDPIIAAAVRRASEEAQASPRSAALRGNLGKLLLAHELWAEARECFSQAMALDPREPRWPYFLGLAQLVESPVAAAASFEHAVKIFPEHESAPRLKLAETWLGLGRLDEAEALYRRVRNREPNSAPAALGLGKVANAREQLLEASGFLSSVLTDPSTRKAAHRLLLTVNQRLGRSNELDRITQTLAELPNDEAFPDPFRAEVEQMKTGEEAWINLADEWIKAGKAADAARLLEQTLQRFPRSDRAMFFLGRARLRLGDAAGAEAILSRAVELAPDSIEAQLQLGVTRLNRGRPKDAQACFRAAIKSKPNLGVAWLNLGLSLGGESERAECVEAFREAIRLRPNLTEAYLGLALVLRADGQKQAAAAELRRALELEPPEPLRRKLLNQLALVESPVPNLSK